MNILNSLVKKPFNNGLCFLPLDDEAQCLESD